VSARCTHHAIRGCCGFRGCLHYGKATPPNPLRFDKGLNGVTDFVARRFDNDGRLLPPGHAGHVRPRRTA
jgi:hypothetical protein